ncbi:MAG: PfkB family carbohydrate kinase [Anaerolineae bacterium]
MEFNAEEGHVLVVGSAGIDVKGRPDYRLAKGSSVPGTIRSSVGGVARNIAENLARLEVPTILLSALGQDSPGQRVMAHCTEAGIDMSHVLSIPGERTGHYMAMLTVDGHLRSAISDNAVIRHVTPDYLRAHEALFRDARMVIIDANLQEDTLHALFELTRKHRVPVCADPTTPSLAGRLRPFLNQIAMITPNLKEAGVLCGKTAHSYDPETALNAAQHLLERGVRIAVVTLGVRGLAYASGPDRGLIPAIRTQVQDETGAGDALTAGIIFGLLNNVPLDEALRLGVSAASLTLRSKDTVVKELSQELLYDQLTI